MVESLKTLHAERGECRVPDQQDMHMPSPLLFAPYLLPRYVSAGADTVLPCLPPQAHDRPAASLGGVLYINVRRWHCAILAASRATERRERQV